MRHVEQEDQIGRLLRIGRRVGGLDPDAQEGGRPIEDLLGRSQ
jgi:hypothetical protein